MSPSRWGRSDYYYYYCCYYYPFLYYYQHQHHPLAPPLPPPSSLYHYQSSINLLGSTIFLFTLNATLAGAYLAILLTFSAITRVR